MLKEKNPNRKTLVKLRISNHKLNIETGLLALAAPLDPPRFPTALCHPSGLYRKKQAKPV